MQTFLSEHTFEESARVLDTKRLNKQLLEGRQIMAALAGETRGWVNHPATRMWYGAEVWLYDYLEACKDAMAERGVSYEKNWTEIQRIFVENWPHQQRAVYRPYWWLDSAEQERVVMTHRASLYHKDPDHYSDYATAAAVVDSNVLRWVCCPTRRAGKPCGYYWPTH